METDQIFRTDLGDDEGGEEWAFGRVAGTTDPKRDDDVEIVVYGDGAIVVRYRNEQ